MADTPDLSVGERFQIEHGTGGYYGPSDQWFEVTAVEQDAIRIRMVEAAD